MENEEVTGIIDYPSDEPAGETSEGFTDAEGFTDGNSTEILEGTQSDSDREIEYSESSAAKLVAARRQIGAGFDQHFLRGGRARLQRIEPNVLSAAFGAMTLLGFIQLRHHPRMLGFSLCEACFELSEAALRGGKRIVAVGEQSRHARGAQ